jgi:hypothetical protein
LYDSLRQPLQATGSKASVLQPFCLSCRLSCKLALLLLLLFNAAVLPKSSTCTALLLQAQELALSLIFSLPALQQDSPDV